MSATRALKLSVAGEISHPHTRRAAAHTGLPDRLMMTMGGTSTAVSHTSTVLKAVTGGETSHVHTWRVAAHTGLPHRLMKTVRDASTVVSHTSTELCSKGGQWGNIPTHSARSTYGPSRTLNDHDETRPLLSATRTLKLRSKGGLGVKTSHAHIRRAGAHTSLPDRLMMTMRIMRVSGVLWAEKQTKNKQTNKQLFVLTTMLRKQAGY